MLREWTEYTGGLRLRQIKFLEPEVLFPSVYLLFLLLAFLSFKISATSVFLLKSFQEPELISYLLSLFGIAIFYTAVKAGKQRRVSLSSRSLLPLLAVLSFLSLELTFPEFLPLNFIAGIGFAISLKLLSDRLEDYRFLAVTCFGIAFLASLTLLVHSIPLFTPGAREEVAVTPQRAIFHGFGMLSGVLMVAFFRKRYSLPALLFLALLGLLAGFKSDAISIILASILAGLLLGRVNLKETLAFFALVGGILTIVSTFIAKVSYFTWKLSPLLYPFYRAGFTFSVFNKIVLSSLPSGITHGKALMDTKQVIASTLILGYKEEHIITSTLFGPAVLDFGIFGLVATALLLGYYLGLMRKLAESRFGTAAYSIALTHLLILIEVGLQPTSLLFLTSLLYLSLREKEK